MKHDCEDMLICLLDIYECRDFGGLGCNSFQSFVDHVEHSGYSSLLSGSHESRVFIPLGLSLLAETIFE
jgi:hypothetical protein